MNTIANYMSVHHTLQVTLGSAVICAAVAAETGIRSVYDIFKLISLNSENQDEKDAVKRNISSNLGSALFYGLCAANIIPGTAIMGAVIFTIYSNCVTDSKKSLQEEYLISKVIAQPCHFLVKKVIFPIAENVVFPVVQKVASCTYHILKQIPLPTHPIWIGSALLVSTIAIVKFALPVVGVALI
jgi:hypothetical protein